MKRTLTTIQKKASKVLLLAILAGAITSCDSVLNYNEDCDIEYCVKFKYGRSRRFCRTSKNGFSLRF